MRPPKGKTRGEEQQITNGPEEERKLAVPLTDKEVRAAGQELAKIHDEIRDLDDERKAVGKDYKARIDIRVNQADRLAQMVNTGKEYRSVNCQWQYDWTQNVKTLYRMDSGESVNTMAIQDHERQGDLGVLSVDKATLPADAAQDPWDGD